LERRRKIHTTMRKSQNKREFTLVQTKMEIELSALGEVWPRLEIHDVSMNGVYLKSPKQLPVGTDCKISIFLGERPEAPKIETDGRVQQVIGEGMAVEFTQIEVEGFGHLRELVLKNTDQVLKVKKDFRSHVEIKKQEVK
jgi:PilZ domain